MYHVSVLAYDGVFASALTGVMDLLNLANGDVTAVQLPLHDA